MLHNYLTRVVISITKGFKRHTPDQSDDPQTWLSGFEPSAAAAVAAAAAAGEEDAAETQGGHKM